MQQHLDKIFLDEKEENLFVKSTELSVCHQECVMKDQLVTLIVCDHDRGHKHAKTIYETLWISYYPVIRETVKSLFKQHVNCLQEANAIAENFTHEEGHFGNIPQ